jgi:hypothetical protein
MLTSNTLCNKKTLDAIDCKAFIHADSTSFLLPVFVLETPIVTGLVSAWNWRFLVIAAGGDHECPGMAHGDWRVSEKA